MSPPLDLHRALEHLQAGRLPQAQALCEEAVRADPGRDEAWNLLGGIACEEGRHDAALGFFQQAIVAAPAVAEYRNNCGAVLLGLDRLAEAEDEFREAVRLEPTYPEAWTNLGHLLHQRRDDAAADCFRRVAELRPDDPAAHNNLGNVLRDVGLFAEAEACFRRALELEPGSAGLLLNLGHVQRDQERFEEAAACYRQAIELDPEFAEAHNYLGATFIDVEQFSAAEELYRRILVRWPDYAEAWLHFGLTLWESHRFEEAEGCYRRAAELRPDHAEMRTTFGMLLLLRGKFNRGWRELEWLPRWMTADVPRFSEPEWDGSALAGRTILVYPDGGFGDIIQFLRYAPLLKERGATVIVVVPAELHRLLSTCSGIDRIIPLGAPLPPFDCWVRTFALPGRFRTTFANIPSTVPYLRADANLVQRWQQRLSSASGLKVGIVWQGNPRYSQRNCRAADRRRSLPLACFTPLACTPSVQLFSLQKGHGTEQLADWKGTRSIIALGDELTDFMDTAAVMMNLDLVITVDSSPAHLAGALGVPVWTALACTGCWRWLLDRDDTPWYPTMRLFRQQQRGDWSAVFARMAQELQEMAREKSTST